MFEVDVNGRKQRYRSKPTMNIDTTGSSGSIPKPLTYDYMPEGYPKKDGWVIEWDGNTEGKVAVDAGGSQFYKISDMVLSADDLLGAMVTFPDYPEENHSLLTDDIKQISEDLIGVDVFGGIFIVRNDNVYWSGLTFPEKGVYTVVSNPKFKMFKENIIPMSIDFMPKNLNVVFRGELGHAPTSCNVTYNELRDWVERDVPVFAVFIIANAKFNITSISLLTDMLRFVYYVPYKSAVENKIFTYKSDGTFVNQSDST